MVITQPLEQSVNILELYNAACSYIVLAIKYINQVFAIEQQDDSRRLLEERLEDLYASRDSLVEEIIELTEYIEELRSEESDTTDLQE
jgi:hypothetical protein